MPADAHVARAVASAASPTFDKTLLPLEMAGAAVLEAYGRGAFMGQVHTDAAVRDAGNEAEERINKWRVALVFRSDLYDAVRAFADTDEGKTLDGERARLLAHWLRDLRRAGHELGAGARAELERLRTRLVEVEVMFQRNLNDYTDGIEVTREQLAGLPDDFVERLSPGERKGTYRVSLEYPEVNPFLDQAHDRTLRRELFMKNWNKAVDAIGLSSMRHSTSVGMLRRCSASRRGRTTPWSSRWLVRRNVWRPSTGICSPPSPHRFAASWTVWANG